MNNVLRIGIDVGSTTVKLVVMDKDNNVLYSDYRRHFSDTKKTINDLFNEVFDKFKRRKFTVVMTRSKLGEKGNLIATIWGLGYKFSPDNE